MTTTQALLDSLLAHKAAINLASTEQKNQALEAMASQLESQSDLILAANAQDMEAAKNSSISTVMLDRLLLNEERIGDMAAGDSGLNCPARSSWSASGGVYCPKWHGYQQEIHSLWSDWHDL